MYTTTFEQPFRRLKDGRGRHPRYREYGEYAHPPSVRDIIRVLEWPDDVDGCIPGEPVQTSGSVDSPALAPAVAP